jgi:hypothetical protein
VSDGPNERQASRNPVDYMSREKAERLIDICGHALIEHRQEAGEIVFEAVKDDPVYLRYFAILALADPMLTSPIPDPAVHQYGVGVFLDMLERLA